MGRKKQQGIEEPKHEAMQVVTVAELQGRVLNRQIVIGLLEDGDRVRVRVRDRELFTAGMEMPCRHVDGDLWELVGNMPRSRGRW